MTPLLISLAISLLTMSLSDAGKILLGFTTAEEVSPQTQYYSAE